MRFRIAVFAGALLAAPTGAVPQDFDCTESFLPAEMAVCADEELQALDEQLASEYGALMSRAPDWAADRIRNEQRDWMRLRNACGYDPPCVAGTYRSRLMDFGAWRDRLGR